MVNTEYAKTSWTFGPSDLKEKTVSFLEISAIFTLSWLQKLTNLYQKLWKNAWSQKTSNSCFCCPCKTPGKTENGGKPEKILKCQYHLKNKTVSSKVMLGILVVWTTKLIAFRIFLNYISFFDIFSGKVAGKNLDHICKRLFEKIIIYHCSCSKFASFCNFFRGKTAKILILPTSPKGFGALYSTVCRAFFKSAADVKMEIPNVTQTLKSCTLRSSSLQMDKHNQVVPALMKVHPQTR